MKHFTIANKDNNNNFCEICEYAGRSDEAIKNAIFDIPILKYNINNIFRCANESDLDWLCNIETIDKKEWYRNSLEKEGKLILKGIKDHITHIFYWLKNIIKSALDN